MKVVLALARTIGARELIDGLRRLGIPYQIASGKHASSIDSCILVYDAPELIHLANCSEKVYLDKSYDTVTSIALIASKLFRKRSLRIGIDIGEGLTAAVMVNGLLLGVKTFTSLNDLENYICRLLEALNPHVAMINVGKEGLQNRKVTVTTLCGIRVRVVGEADSNRLLTPIHRVNNRKARKRDWIAALNIALQ